MLSKGIIITDLSALLGLYRGCIMSESISSSSELYHLLQHKNIISCNATHFFLFSCSEMGLREMQQKSSEYCMPSYVIYEANYKHYPTFCYSKIFLSVCIRISLIIGISSGCVAFLLNHPLVNSYSAQPTTKPVFYCFHTLFLF